LFVFFIYSFVCRQTSEHDILKTSEPIVMPVGTSSPWETINFRGQEVKGQGRTRPEIDLETWRKHHSQRQ